MATKKRGFFSRLLLLHRMFIRAVVLGTLAYVAYLSVGSMPKPITVGLIFPLTGALGADGNEASQGVRFAIDEINERGGLLHHQIGVVEVDAASSDDQSSLVGKLVGEGGADVLFGCVHPGCRRQLREILSHYGTLLVYPFHLEGLGKLAADVGELPVGDKNGKTSVSVPGVNFVRSLYSQLFASISQLFASIKTKVGASGELVAVIEPEEPEPVTQGELVAVVEPEEPEPVTQTPLRESRVLSTGPLPNQDLLPGILWAMERFGPRVFLVFNDTLYGRVAEQIAESAIIAGKGSVVGKGILNEDRDGDGEAVAQHIVRIWPDVIINIALGAENVPLYKTLDVLVQRDSRIPNLIVHAGHVDLKEMGWETLATGYVMGFYDAESHTKDNSAFKARFARVYGDTNVIGDEFYLGYSSVMVWAAAVNKAKSTEPDAVIEALPGIQLDLPSGPERISHKSLHAILRPLILQIDNLGKLKLVWSASSPIEPVVNYPLKDTEDWEKFLLGLHREWGGSWR
jgi:ABC-type branched-subunit amino acid transport system substrate-binding protein